MDSLRRAVVVDVVQKQPAGEARPQIAAPLGIMVLLPLPLVEQPVRLEAVVGNVSGGVRSRVEPSDEVGRSGPAVLVPVARVVVVGPAAGASLGEGGFVERVRLNPTAYLKSRF